jgi:spectinomycin phosphotransferase
MKTPLSDANAIIPSLLLENWDVALTGLHYIPIGNSAYSYRVETQSGMYYLKVVDQRLGIGRKTAARMQFSLPLQRLIAQQQRQYVSAPLPLMTVGGELSVNHTPFLLALYTFIQGDTLANSYPLSSMLVERIAQALASVHTLPVLEEIRRHNPQDNLLAPFDADLTNDLALIDHISIYDALHLQRLRAAINPRQEQIRAFIAHSQEYAQKVRIDNSIFVICHGDPWGGNIIPTSKQQLTFLDWESSVIAPPERDASSYIDYLFPDFNAFDKGYRTIHKGLLHWDGNLLAYYAYRQQLRNLAQWLHNLLHEDLDDEQRKNDLEMLGFHCLDRWQHLEQQAKELVITLS